NGFFFFGLVHSGISGCIDDQVGANPTYDLSNLVGLCQVQLVAIKRDDFADAREKMQQFSTDLTILAREQNFQVHLAAYRGSNSREVTARIDNLASLSETSGLSIPQAMFRSGSFQAIPCSSSRLY